GDEARPGRRSAGRVPQVRRITERGTEMHVEWVETVFAADLAGLPPAARRARVGALATALDVYTWHLLRRREGLGRGATRSAMRALVEGARGAATAPPTEAAPAEAGTR